MKRYLKGHINSNCVLLNLQPSVNHGVITAMSLQCCGFSGSQYSVPAARVGPSAKSYWPSDRMIHGYARRYCECSFALALYYLLALLAKSDGRYRWT